MLNINYFNFNLVKQNERKIYQQQKHEKLNNESQKKKEEKHNNVHKNVQL